MPHSILEEQPEHLQKHHGARKFKSKHLPPFSILEQIIVENAFLEFLHGMYSSMYNMLLRYCANLVQGTLPASSEPQQYPDLGSRSLCNT